MLSTRAEKVSTTLVINALQSHGSVTCMQFYHGSSLACSATVNTACVCPVLSTGESQVGAHDEGSGVLRELMSSPPRRAPPQVPSAGPSVPARVVDLKQPQPTYL